METQEAKLKKIRAMRGQVDYSKLINGNLCENIRTAETTVALWIIHTHTQTAVDDMLIV